MKNRNHLDRKGNGESVLYSVKADLALEGVVGVVEAVDHRHLVLRCVDRIHLGGKYA